MICLHNDARKWLRPVVLGVFAAENVNTLRLYLKHAPHSSATHIGEVELARGGRDDFERPGEHRFWAEGVNANRETVKSETVTITVVN